VFLLPASSDNFAHIQPQPDHSHHPGWQWVNNVNTEYISSYLHVYQYSYLPLLPPSYSLITPAPRFLLSAVCFINFDYCSLQVTICICNQLYIYKGQSSYCVYYPILWSDVVIVGFKRSDYSVAENRGSVELCVSVLGPDQPRAMSLLLSFSQLSP